MKASTKFFWSFLLKSLLMLVIVACNSEKSENKDTTLQDVIAHYKTNGYDGEFSVKLFSLIGASGGGKYAGDGFDFEIYQFDDKAKSKNIAAYKRAYSKGYFAVIIHKGEDEKIIRILQNY